MHTEGLVLRWKRSRGHLHSSVSWLTCALVGWRGGVRSVMTCSVLLETHCKLYRSPNKSCWKENKTQDIRALNDGGAAAGPSGSSLGGRGGSAGTARLEGTSLHRGQTQGPSHKGLIVGV